MTDGVSSDLKHWVKKTGMNGCALLGRRAKIHTQDAPKASVSLRMVDDYLSIPSVIMTPVLEEPQNLNAISVVVALRLP